MREEGNVLNACILLKVVPTKADTILDTIRKIAGVRKAYFTYGRFDLAVFVEVEDYKKLREVTTQINGIEGIRSTETLPEA
ncbi:MAG TPA: Lrp/AsnC ligand binding domain-containing protein [Candidatus Bathyarchaeia archaeon]|nr:Lrp/AsnC ligand binding domain-containing protein [Candidatus Bathyarchaeia archaeon]